MFLSSGLNRRRIPFAPAILSAPSSPPPTGLSQDKTIDISVDPTDTKDVEVKVTKARKGLAQKPSKRLHTKTLKRDPRRMQKAAGAEAYAYRMDLKVGRAGGGWVDVWVVPIDTTSTIGAFSRRWEASCNGGQLAAQQGCLVDGGNLRRWALAMSVGSVVVITS